MSLSPEMTRYITTGRCPHCSVAILSTAYVSKNSKMLQRAADELASSGNTSVVLTDFKKGAMRVRSVPISTILAPSDVRAKVTKFGTMQCLTCLRSWTSSVSSTDLLKRPTSGARKEPLFQDKGLPGQELRLSPSPPPSLDKIPGQELRLPLSPPPTLDKIPAQEPQLPPSPPPRQVDLSKCRLLDVTRERKVAKLYRKEKKTYQNHSSVTVTQTITITNSITRTVTIESAKLKSHSEGAGITLVGFAAIQGQIQHQLGEHYAVALQSTFSVSEQISVSIPPYSTIQHIIRWKMVKWVGTALLGKSGRVREPVAKIPYQVSLGLTFENDFVDVHDVPVKKKKPRS